VVTNKLGGKQHLIEQRYDLLPAQVNKDVASVLYQGALDYGEWNWIKVPMADHINHAIAHLQNALCKYQDGERVDYEDLTHAICRSYFAAHMLIKGNNEASSAQ
jgi:hypothetical protein